MQAEIKPDCNLNFPFGIILVVISAVIFLYSHADTHESFILPFSFVTVCETIPTVVANNHWRLIEANQKIGHFRVKIGLSWKTWGETMLIEIGQVDETSTKVSIHCTAHHQLYDWGKNRKDIMKLHDGLLGKLGRKS